MITDEASQTRDHGYGGRVQSGHVSDVADWSWIKVLCRAFINELYRSSTQLSNDSMIITGKVQIIFEVVRYHQPWKPQPTTTGNHHHYCCHHYQHHHHHQHAYYHHHYCRLHPHAPCWFCLLLVYQWDIPVQQSEQRQFYGPSLQQPRSLGDPSHLQVGLGMRQRCFRRVYVPGLVADPGVFLLPSILLGSDEKS
ncbi:hypothetical protein F4778DRAFT_282313 [Xylariomycetidae sp. FL2044]|nr:hypothetical protein F4778DRAFT_282313 [Xylariomycetidae sp. FL2044]